MATSAIEEYKAGINDALSDGSFLKISLGNYKGADQDLKNIYIRVVHIKRADKLSFTYRYKTRDVVKNYPIIEGLELIAEKIKDGFALCTLFTTANDLSLELRNGHYTLKKKSPTLKARVSTAHNKEKKRLVKAEAGKNYLVDLKITDAQGEVFKNAQDKYKQINQYVELLSPMLKDFDQQQIRHVADMGSGKGYLTFALYDYLHQVLNWDTKVVGVEYRKDLVDLCNGIASKSGFKDLSFVEGTIEDYDAINIDLLIALHACDTATDDAIFKGINAGAKLIVVAPCCHKQIRKQITAGKSRNELDFLLKYGVFMERQAEMVTDGMRALILEYFGYKTKVMEFISDVHTPKNVLIVGVKNKSDAADKEVILQKITDTKAFFGIGHHHLERLCGLDAV